jgi:hypothetical protein
MIPRDSPAPAWLTKTDDDPNGMKLASECIQDQLLTQFLPGFNHERDTLGSPLLDARLHPMGAFRINNQRHE